MKKLEITKEEKELLINSIRFSLEKYEGISYHFDIEMRILAKKKIGELNSLWEKIELSKEK